MVKIETYTIHLTAFIYQPVATPHQSRQNIGSEMPIFHRDSFPPGEAKGQLQKPVPFNILFSSIHSERRTPHSPTTHLSPYKRRRQPSHKENFHLPGAETMPRRTPAPMTPRI